jgi:hypothetical protein
MLAVEIVAAVSTAISAIVVIGLFIWAAIKDGQEDDDARYRLEMQRRQNAWRFPER